MTFYDYIVDIWTDIFGGLDSAIVDAGYTSLLPIDWFINLFSLLTVLLFFYIILKIVKFTARLFFVRW